MTDTPRATVESTSHAWHLRYHYHCGVCGWIGLQSDFPAEPEKCPCCGANPDGTDPWPDGTYNQPPHGWTCFHCGETFHHEIPARRHFGSDGTADPACRIKGAQENGLVIALRAAEADLVRYREEDTDLHRQIARMASEHDTALRCEEETGYARGLRDERARTLRIIERIKAGLRNGGARNACDAIADDLRDGRNG